MTTLAKGNFIKLTLLVALFNLGGRAGSSNDQIGSPGNNSNEVELRLVSGDFCVTIAAASFIDQEQASFEVNTVESAEQCLAAHSRLSPIGPVQAATYVS